MKKTVVENHPQLHIDQGLHDLVRIYILRSPAIDIRQLISLQKLHCQDFWSRKLCHRGRNIDLFQFGRFTVKLMQVAFFTTKIKLTFQRAGEFGDNLPRTKRF